jgi:homoserine kinase
MEEVFAAARAAGAYGAALCGSGPSVLAVAPEEKADRVGQSMVDMFAGHGHAASYIRVNVDEHGATLVA